MIPIVSSTRIAEAKCPIPSAKRATAVPPAAAARA
jgi:hypothetical protein